MSITNIEALLDDMIEYNLLPSEKSPRPEKKACLRLYGLMRNSLNQSRKSADPIVEYKEMLNTENSLRQRLSALIPNKDLPLRVADLLDELRNQLNEVISLGSDGIRSLQAAEHAEKEALKEQRLEMPVRTRPAPEERVPISRLKKVQDLLKEEREKTARLSAENNDLVRRLQQVTSERDTFRRQLRP